MICPQCEAEYVDGILECADCGVPLVENLDEEEDEEYEWEGGVYNEDIDYIEIARLVSLGDILLVKSILDSEQIKYYLHGWNSYLNRIDGDDVILYVAEEQQEDAENLVNNLDFNNYRVSTNTEPEDD